MLEHELLARMVEATEHWGRLIVRTQGKTLKDSAKLPDTPRRLEHADRPLEPAPEKQATTDPAVISRFFDQFH